MTGRRSAPHFLAAALGGGPFSLRVKRTAAVLASAAYLAGDSRSRRQGLLGRASLAPGEALVIAPSQGIHTFGMAFPIDVVFADRRGMVLAVAATVPPRRCRLRWGAFAVVELENGVCEEVGVAAGDELEVAPAQSAPEDEFRAEQVRPISDF